MKSETYLKLVCLFLLLSLANSIFSQLPISAPPGNISVHLGNAKKLSQFSGELIDIINQSKADKNNHVKNLSAGVQIDGNRIKVNIITKKKLCKKVESKLQAYDFEKTSSLLGKITGWIPLAELENVRKISGVKYVSAAMAAKKPIPDESENNYMTGNQNLITTDGMYVSDQDLQIKKAIKISSKAEALLSDDPGEKKGLKVLQAKPIGSSTGLINWAISSKKKVRSYIIQWEKGENQFQSIAEVKKSQIGKEIASYNLLVENIPPGAQKFKLWQKHSDRTIELVGSVELNVQDVTKINWSYAYPSKDRISPLHKPNIKYSSKIFDSTGKIVYENNEQLGLAIRPVDSDKLKRWGSGDYIYQYSYQQDETVFSRGQFQVSTSAMTVGF